MRYRLVEQGSVFSTRARGDQMLAELEGALLDQPTAEFVLDFEGVNYVSFSFADEFVGRLVQRAHDEQTRVPQLINLPPQVEGILSLSLRSRELPTLSENGLLLAQ